MKLGSLRKIAVIAVLLPSAQSLLAIKAQPALSGLQTSAKPHTVTLTWKASPSHVPGYNVYRKSKSETDYRKIHPHVRSPFLGLISDEEIKFRYTLFSGLEISGM